MAILNHATATVLSCPRQARYTRDMSVSFKQLSQLISREEVAAVVHRFYRRLMSEPKLAGYFAHVTDWPAHEGHITDFWWGVMGGHVEAPRPHAMDRGHRDLEFNQQELALWLALFEQTLHENLPQEITTQWDNMARAIGQKLIVRMTKRIKE